MAPRKKDAAEEPVAVWSPGLICRLQQRSSEEACAPLFDPWRMHSEPEMSAPGRPVLTFGTAQDYKQAMREAAFSVARRAVKDTAAAAQRAGQSLSVAHQLSTRLTSTSSLMTFHTNPPSTPASSPDPRVLSPGALLLLSWRADSPAPSAAAPASAPGKAAPEEMQLLVRVCARDDELLACRAFPTCSLHSTITAEPCCQAGSLCREYISGSRCTLSPAGDTRRLEHTLAAIERLLASSPLLPYLMSPSDCSANAGVSSAASPVPQVRLLSWRAGDRLPALVAAVGVQRAVMAAGWARSNEATLRHALADATRTPVGQGARSRLANLMQPADRPRQLVVFRKQADLDAFMKPIITQGLASGLSKDADGAAGQPEVVTVTRSPPASPEVELHSRVGALLCAAAGGGAVPRGAAAQELADVAGQLDATIECALQRQRVCTSLQLVLTAAQERAASNGGARTADVDRLASSLAAAQAEVADSIRTAVSFMQELSALRDADKLSRTAASAVRQAQESSRAGLTWDTALARQQQLLEARAQSSMPPLLTPQQQAARTQVLRHHAACDVLLLSKQAGVLSTLVAGVLQQADIVCCCAADAARWELADEAAPAFACVMVAGADGVAEVELLPPLSLGARSLVLFGRPPPASAAGDGDAGSPGAPQPAGCSLFHRLWKAGAPIRFMDVAQATGGDRAAGSPASKAGDTKPQPVRSQRAGRQPGSAATLPPQTGKSAH